MFPKRLISFSLVMLLFGWASCLASAQESKAQVDSEPIYLEEVEPDPTASIAARHNVKEIYEDKSTRAERSIVKLSDNRILSDGKYIEYYRNGKKYVEGTYDMGVPKGEWQYGFPNGQLCKKVTFQKGQPHGQWDVFDKEGTRTSERSYQNGKRHGKWVNYHKNSEKPMFEISYEQGQVVGERVTYYLSGKKRQLVTFKDGKMDGPMIEWTEAGEKRVEATFKAGEMVGDIKRFDGK